MQNHIEDVLTTCLEASIEVLGDTIVVPASGCIQKSIDYTTIRGPAESTETSSFLVSILEVSIPIILHGKIKTIYEAEDINKGRLLASDHRAEFCDLLR